MTQEQKFSGSVLVAREGKILISKGYGLADIDKQVPNTAQTRYRIHWITMQFTAMAILLLQAEDKLHVQDRICEYVPGCPPHWQEITIHHLLTHTSGMSDWIQPWDSSAGTPSSPLQLIAQFKEKAPYFQPGEELRYSSNGYIVLGYIIEEVSGESYAAFLQRRIFVPLGMRNTGYDFNSDNVAVGHKPIGIKAPVADLLFQYSAGGLYASVEDLYLWDQALYGEELIPKEYLDMMFTGYARTPSMDIEEADYGYGWFIGEILNRPVIAHGGVISGFCAMFFRFPNEQVTIIVLRNYQVDIHDRLEIELAKMVF